MKNKISSNYALGLDIGVSSIGWILIGLDEKAQPQSILRVGTHIFDAGVEGDVESGKDEARGAARRMARLPRRMHWRRQRRRKKVLRLEAFLRLCIALGVPAAEVAAKLERSYRRKKTLE